MIVVHKKQLFWIENCAKFMISGQMTDLSLYLLLKKFHYFTLLILNEIFIQNDSSNVIKNIFFAIFSLDVLLG